jgi:hypothetical protein
LKPFKVTVKYGGRDFEIEGSASPFVAARTNCANEDATPAEGGIEEITKVYLLDKNGSHVELPDFLQEYLESEVIDNNQMDDEINEALEGQ